MNTTSTPGVEQVDAPKCAECAGYGTLGGQLLPCFDCKGTGRATHPQQPTDFAAWLAQVPELGGFSIGAKGWLVWSAAQQAIAPPAQEDPTQAMLDMLGRLHPYEQPYHGDEAKAKVYERLERAFVIQQPWPVPDQAAIVWRGDLMDMRYDLVHKQAAFESWKRERAAQSPAARDVLAERRRQVEKEGYSTDHDDEHPSGEIAAYAAFYAMPPAVRDWPAEETGYGATWGEAIIPAHWGPAKTGDRRRELVKAGALILAEIERIDRAAAKGAAGQEGGAA
jgi:hypothetical protein